MKPIAITSHVCVVEAPYGMKYLDGRPDDFGMAYDVVAKSESQHATQQIVLVCGFESKLEAEQTANLIREAMTQSGKVPDELTPVPVACPSWEAGP